MSKTQIFHPSKFGWVSLKFYAQDYPNCSLRLGNTKFSKLLYFHALSWAFTSYEYAWWFQWAHSLSAKQFLHPSTSKVPTISRPNWKWFSHELSLSNSSEIWERIRFYLSLESLLKQSLWESHRFCLKPLSKSKGPCLSFQSIFISR